ncbi:Hypothetical protein HDN1F_20200 [gamma proteobacterium HdN1]|nr:Hypothetical protein HDN1F_20200 [gamma proteobacterium HdN1]
MTAGLALWGYKLVRSCVMRFVAALWGVLGVSALLGSAIYRLYPHVLELADTELHWYHWAALVVNIVVMGYSEGYRGFQKGFSPRVAARARHLNNNASRLRHKLLSPLFVIGYIHAPARRRISAIAITSIVVVLVVLVRYLEQPWRGIVDAGVCAGLIWGLASVLWMSYQALTSERFDANPDLPEKPKPQAKGGYSENKGVYSSQ